MKKTGMFKIPLWVATTPIDGECLVNRYWTTVVENGVRSILFYYGGKYEGEHIISPQCNINEYTARRLSDRVFNDCEIIQIPVVFTDHARRAIDNGAELTSF